MMQALEYGLIGVPAFVAVISFIVVFHELGHYWAGRLFGVHAEAFSIGFGPTLFSWTDGQGTQWRVAALPLGGYVRFRGDANAASAPDHAELARLRDEHDAPETVFHFKPLWQRAVIVSAGPVANLVLAAAIFTVFSIGRTEVIHPPVVGAVVEESAAARAGIQPGDLILAIEGREIEDFRDIQQAVYLHADTPLSILLERNGERLEKIVAPQAVTIQQGSCDPVRIGQLGVGSGGADPVVRTVGLLEAPAVGVSETINTAGSILGYIGRVVTLQASPEHLSGPVGIFKAATCVTRDSLGQDAEQVAAAERATDAGVSLLFLAAMLSVALGLMNLMPIPVLDGGHLMYYAYEAIARRPPGPRLQIAGFWVGMTLILGILVIATANDLT